jgi:hypothetical protein
MVGARANSSGSASCRQRAPWLDRLASAPAYALGSSGRRNTLAARVSLGTQTGSPPSVTAGRSAGDAGQSKALEATETAAKRATPRFSAPSLIWQLIYTPPPARLRRRNRPDEVADPPRALALFARTFAEPAAGLVFPPICHLATRSPPAQREDPRFPPPSSTRGRVSLGAALLAPTFLPMVSRVPRPCEAP